MLMLEEVYVLSYHGGEQGRVYYRLPTLPGYTRGMTVTAVHGPSMQSGSDGNCLGFRGGLTLGRGLEALLLPPSCY